MTYPFMFIFGTTICVLATAAIFAINLLDYRLSDRAQNTAIGCAAITHLFGLSVLMGAAVMLVLR